VKKQVLILTLIVAIVALLGCSQQVLGATTPELTRVANLDQVMSDETASQPSNNAQLIKFEQTKAVTFPSPEELVEYGVLPKPHAERPPIQWGWGEYDPFYPGPYIAQKLGAFVLSGAGTYVSPLPHARISWEQIIDKESALALKQIAERLYVPNPENLMHFVPRGNYSMRFEPDYSFKPVIKTGTRREGTKVPYIVFSSFVTIAFEGETGKEIIRLRVHSGFPYDTMGSVENLQLRILE